MIRYIVKWSKYFTSGHLKGIMIDQSLEFATLEQATKYVGFLNKHTEIPFKSMFDNTECTYHCARIFFDYEFNLSYTK